MANVSDDLVWEICNGQNAYLCKRKASGGVFFSRDPMNLTNKHSRKYEGFVNAKAVGIQPTPNGGIAITTKTPEAHTKPAAGLKTLELKCGPRKASAAAAQKTARDEYRPDLRAEAVTRASMVKKSQNPKRDAPAKKLRGASARKEAQGLS